MHSAAATGNTPRCVNALAAVTFVMTERIRIMRTYCMRLRDVAEWLAFLGAACEVGYAAIILYAQHHNITINGTGTKHELCFDNEVAIASSGCQHRARRTLSIR